MNNRKRFARLAGCFLALALSFVLVLPVNAVTIYETDGTFHDEGYIFVGESHVFCMAKAMVEATDEQGNVIGLDGLRYQYCADYSVATDPYGHPNTHTMSGNLFFVFEGNPGSTDGQIQTSKEYIYSDGNGARGRGVERIHEIINGNPNIAHWNIISYHGAVAVLSRDAGIGDYYVKSYQSWIDYEFPEADCYFLSMSTMTKHFKRAKNKNAINDALAAAFPEQYLDYMDFFSERYPQEMLDPTEKSDTAHWKNSTYIELAIDVVKAIQQRRSISVQPDAAVQALEE